MENNKVLIFGGIGAASTVAMAIVDANRNGFNDVVFKGFINDKDGLDNIDGFPIVGGYNDVEKFVKQGYLFINTVYKIDGQIKRVQLFEDLNIPDNQLAKFIHPRAYIAPNVEIGPGCVVLPNANVSSNVKMGKCIRVMTGAMIGHDCNIDDHAFFAANACIGSHINFGRAAYVGLNSTIGGKLIIGDFSVIGMGAVVTKNVEPFSIIAGNPGKHLRFTNDKK
jgi:acetyltransferase EpsM